MTETIGRKDDNGKPWAATVLAGFWRVAGRDKFESALADREDLDDERSEILATLDAWFDVDSTIDERVWRACLLVQTCVPSFYLRGAVAVGSYGARKYARDNWLRVDDGVMRYYEAVGRHVLDIICGEWIDAEDKGGSGLPNIYHVFWGILAAGELVRRQKEASDKTVVPVGETVIAPSPEKPRLALPLRVGMRYRTRLGFAVMIDHYDAYDQSYRTSGGWVREDGRAYCTYPEDGDLVEGPL